MTSPRPPRGPAAVLGGALAATLSAAAPSSALPYVPHEDWWPAAWNESFAASPSAFRYATGSISTGFLYQRADVKLEKRFDDVRLRAHWIRQADHTDREQPDRLQSRSLYGSYRVDIEGVAPFYAGFALQHNYFKNDERAGPLFRLAFSEGREIELATVVGMNVKWIELFENNPSRGEPRRFRVKTYRFYPVVADLSGRWAFSPQLHLELADQAFVSSYRLETVFPPLDNVRFDERWNRAKLELRWKPLPGALVWAVAEHEQFHASPAGYWDADWPVAYDRHRGGPFRGELRLLLRDPVAVWRYEARAYAGFRHPEPLDLTTTNGNQSGATVRVDLDLPRSLSAGLELAGSVRSRTAEADGREGAVHLHVGWHPRFETRLLGRTTFLRNRTGGYHLFSLALLCAL